MAATIPRAVLEYVTEEVNALSADAQARVLAVLASIEWTPENIAECRDIVIQALAAIMPTYTDAAAQVGADMYDAVRETAVGEAMGATAISGYEPDATVGAVKAFVQDIVDGKPAAQFNRKVLSRVDREVRRAENVSVAENAMRDPLKPKYARVPSGSETCGFCLMLSSFGFHYSSRSAASHAHDNCDCRVVAQFEKSGVEGYDPDEMYKHYKQCLDSLGGTSGIRRQWKSLPDDERKKRIEEHGGKEPDAFQAFLNGRISAEIERRDPNWFRTGSPTPYSYDGWSSKEKRSLTDSEKASHRFLSEHGFPFTPIPTDRSAPASIDLWMWGDFWELKSVTGDERRVSQRITESVSKWRRLHDAGLATSSTPKIVIDNRGGRSSTDKAVEAIKDGMKEYESDGFGVAYLIVDDDTILRIEK